MSSSKQTAATRWLRRLPECCCGGGGGSTGNGAGTGTGTGIVMASSPMAANKSLAGSLMRNVQSEGQPMLAEDRNDEDDSRAAAGRSGRHTDAAGMAAPPPSPVVVGVSGGRKAYREDRHRHEERAERDEAAAAAATTATTAATAAAAAAAVTRAAEQRTPQKALGLKLSPSSSSPACMLPAGGSTMQAAAPGGTPDSPTSPDAGTGATSALAVSLHRNLRRDGPPPARCSLQLLSGLSGQAPKAVGTVGSLRPRRLQAPLPSPSEHLPPRCVSTSSTSKSAGFLGPSQSPLRGSGTKLQQPLKHSDSLPPSRMVSFFQADGTFFDVSGLLWYEAPASSTTRTPSQGSQQGPSSAAASAAASWRNIGALLEDDGWDVLIGINEGYGGKKDSVAVGVKIAFGGLSPEDRVRAEKLRKVRARAVKAQQAQSYDEARNLFEEVLKGYEAIFGMESITTVKAAIELAGQEMLCGNFAVALPLRRRGYLGMVAKLGPTSAVALREVDRLALCMLALKKYSAIEELYERTLGELETVHGRRHLLTLTCMHNQAIFASARGNLVEAERTLAKVLAALEANEPIDRPRYLHVANSWAAVAQAMGKHKEAEQKLVSIFTDLEASLNQMDPEVLEVFLSLGKVARAKGEHAERHGPKREREK